MVVVAVLLITQEQTQVVLVVLVLQVMLALHTGHKEKRQWHILQR
jgi:hypothetical protein